MFRKFSQWFDSPPADKTSHARGQPCGHGGCMDEGIYRAPKSRYHLESGVDDWHWFCLAHIREYNARWNYYANMTEAEIEHERRADVTWQRPSWPLGASTNSAARIHPSSPFQDPFDLFNETPPYTSPSPRALTSPESKALAVLGLSYPFSQDDLRRCYRNLVKKYHPDANGGSPEAEEKIKRINEAYEVLKSVF